MKLQKILISITAIVLMFQINFSQEPEETENWIHPHQFGYPLKLTYKRYTKEDVEIARGILEKIRETPANEEWEGQYLFSNPGIVNERQLYWLNDVGFMEYSIYTCFPTLNYLNYGKIIDTFEHIQLVSEFNSNLPRNTYTVEKLVKVKWGERHYLIPEESLSKFSDAAAGLHIPSKDAFELPDFDYFVKSEDYKKKPFGLPAFPAFYKKYLRHPIETEILKINERTIRTKKNEWNDEIERSVNYEILIDAGNTQGVKVGMIFYISEVDNQIIEIVEVKNKTSVGMVTRKADENEKDVCHDETYTEIECKVIKAELNITTKPQIYF